ncbi:unnamed protein product [Linum trigynum]|uniref:Reverse transcriptase domain-containing protein n=1 Tax=Linum trigynum TaxID=586398 RepID=A0AAV2FXM1_9ROSI
MKELSKKLAGWNKEVFGNIYKRKKELFRALKSLEMFNERKPSRSSMEKEKATREELEDILWQEELLWRQKARVKLVVKGDLNTRYFHNCTLSRRKRNKITRLQDAEGNWIDDPAMLQDMAREHFVNLFTNDAPCSGIQLPALFPHVDESWLSRIGKTPNIADIIAVLMGMNGLKAPGKDGFHALFFQKCWNTVGTDFASLVLKCFAIPSTIQSINETLLALIPKVDSPSSMNHFRPISLCNVGYKVIAKCIANNLKHLMPHLVHPNQSSFVPKHHITDNIIILQETVHSMSRKTGKKGTMLLKIDLAKAYDRIDWKFLEETLMAARFPSSCIRLIMACVTTTSFQVLWSGGQTDSFTPTRGLRQGCPLSPCLFTLCIERLSHCILQEVNDGNWKPVCLSPGVLLFHISSLLTT